MTAAVFSLLFILVAGMLLCVPPILALVMLARRYATARDDRRIGFRIAMGLAAAVLAFNLGIAFLYPPHLASLEGTDGLSRIHAVALVLSWLCLWAALAMALLMRMRKRSYP